VRTPLNWFARADTRGCRCGNNVTGGRRIAGLVSAESLLFDGNLDPSRKVAELITGLVSCPRILRLDAALDRMQRSGQRLAVVLGRDGSDVGIVALEDILKTIFGEVRL
jgi:CBS domain containing-hemolysin-like protein